MNVQRETIYGALWDRIRSIPGIRTASRRLLHVSEVPAGQQPAIFLAQTGQTPAYQAGRTIIWTFGADIYLYVRDPKGKDPGPIINPIMDALVAVFAPDNQMVNACTFGGLCHKVELGNIETDEGTMGEQAIAIIPVTMTVVGTPI
jgi:hypothetical protein